MPGTHVGVQRRAKRRRLERLVKGRALARPSERSERFEPVVRRYIHFLVLRLVDGLLRVEL